MGRLGQMVAVDKVLGVRQVELVAEDCTPGSKQVEPAENLVVAIAGQVERPGAMAVRQETVGGILADKRCLGEPGKSGSGN